MQLRPKSDYDGLALVPLLLLSVPHLELPIAAKGSKYRPTAESSGSPRVFTIRILTLFARAAVSSQCSRLCPIVVPFAITFPSAYTSDPSRIPGVQIAELGATMSVVLFSN